MAIKRFTQIEGAKQHESGLSAKKLSDAKLAEDVLDNARTIEDYDIGLTKIEVQITDARNDLATSQQPSSHNTCDRFPSPHLSQDCVQKYRERLQENEKLRAKLIEAKQAMETKIAMETKRIAEEKQAEIKFMEAANEAIDTDILGSDHEVEHSY